MEIFAVGRYDDLQTGASGFVARQIQNDRFEDYFGYPIFVNNAVDLAYAVVARTNGIVREIRELDNSILDGNRFVRMSPRDRAVFYATLPQVHKLSNL